MNWITGLVLSYLFIFTVIGVAQILLSRGTISASVTRKIVHIGVAHWWIFAMFAFDSLAVALIGPVSFIVINWISYRRHIFSAMEHEVRRKNLGTIYFPIALTLLVLLTWGGPFPRWYGLVAMLVLGWGDGLASLVGEWYGRRPGAITFDVPGGSKSGGGTAAIFLATTTVSVLAIWLFTGPLSSSAEVSPAAAGYGVNRTLIGWFVSVAEQTWVGTPGDSTVLLALSRLNGIARTVAAQIAAVGPAITSDLVNPAHWQMSPTAIVSVAVILASIGAAVELMTPWGLDNLTLPLVIFVALSLLLPLPEAWLVRLAWALVLNVCVAVGAYVKRSVTASGSVAGAAVGFAIYLSGGFFYWSVLMAFFFSSSILSRLKSSGKERATRMHAKGSRRDAIQVLANGGLAATMAVLHGVTGRPLFMLGFAIALAAANADTWASEIGVLSRRDPISILTLRTIPRGTSGGVSAMGSVASLAGAAFIAVWFVAGYWITRGWNAVELGWIVLAITGGGFLGSLVDSLLGATVQAQYWDALRDAVTERRHNAQGVANRLVRGFHLFTNDTVNAVSGLVSTGIILSAVV